MSLWQIEKQPHGVPFPSSVAVLVEEAREAGADQRERDQPLLAVVDLQIAVLLAGEFYRVKEVTPRPGGDRFVQVFQQLGDVFLRPVVVSLVPRDFELAFAEQVRQGSRLRLNRWVVSFGCHAVSPFSFLIRACLPFSRISSRHQMSSIASTSAGEIKVSPIRSSKDRKRLRMSFLTSSVNGP